MCGRFVVGEGEQDVTKALPVIEQNGATKEAIAYVGEILSMVNKSVIPKPRVRMSSVCNSFIIKKIML